MNIKYLLAVIPLLTLTGCTQSGPPVHAVKGQVQLQGGDISPLSGHIVEVALASDPSVRASGEIKPDGKFELESLLEGKIKKGVLEGKYTARIVLADDDPQQRRTAFQTIHPKFLRFESSGLGLEVPAKEPVQLEVLRR
jgi:hypothetical protein